MAKDAFETRLAGNELFKAGELQQALRKYHQVLLVLKGINWQSEPQKVVDSSEPRASPPRSVVHSTAMG